RRGGRRLRGGCRSQRPGRTRQDRSGRLGRQHRPVQVCRSGGGLTRYAGIPQPPARIDRLEELAVDLWWAWHLDARDVFRRLDYALWRATAHNPVRMLWTIPREKLETAANDPQFITAYDRAVAGLDDARAARNTWWSERFSTIGRQ